MTTRTDPVRVYASTHGGTKTVSTMICCLHESVMLHHVARVLYEYINSDYLCEKYARQVDNNKHYLYEYMLTDYKYEENAIKLKTEKPGSPQEPSPKPGRPQGRGLSGE